MKNSKFIELETYLNKELLKIGNTLFKALKDNNINVQKERKELAKSELEQYEKIYADYENSIIELKMKILKKYGNIKGFDTFFAIRISNIIAELGNNY